MTENELDKLDKRITEIDQILDLCDDNWDADVIDVLEVELDQIIVMLEESIAQGMKGA